MKTMITLLLFTFISLTDFGQSYQPLPTSNAMWRENSTGFQCSCCSDYQYTITGDTVINTITYHKLQKTGVNFLEDVIGNCTSNAYSVNQYKGCFRNDSTNKLVYYIPEFTSNETVLYDFNLSIGDTVPPSPLNYNGNFINIVTDIDTVFLGGVYRKRFKLDSCFLEQLYYIEGIGSTYGLLSPTMCPFEAFYNLQCFTNNSLPVYPNSTTSCSSVTANLESLETNQFSISPNPTSGALFITTNLLAYDISIFNSIGQLIQKKSIHSNSTFLDISNLPAGALLIQFSDNNKVLYKQTIIRQ
ncbi:MAG: T9SS C-terminal target domain-containing protein [Flavobacteriia bacterium]|nr:T9SS C-terminal target domain-containing protein [Flavobacteriia bacterium]